jgi:hypothetical protein
MAFGSATFSDAGGAVSDIFGGYATAAGLRLKAHGDLAEAGNYDLAATLALQNEEFTKESTAIKGVQTQRQIYQAEGTTQADVAGAGFTNSGSALDIMRSNSQQGALTKQVLERQGQITEAGYTEQAQSYTNMAAAARFAAQSEQDQAGTAERNGWITGGFKAAAAVATLFTGGLMPALGGG